VLEGVNLLYTFEQTTGIWLVVGVWIGLALLIGSMIYSWIITSKNQTIPHLLISIVVSVMCLGCFIGAVNVHTTTETLHKVTIDNSVSYREFTYYYEVVDVEGEIYTIREIPPAPTNEPENTVDPTWDTNAVE